MWIIRLLLGADRSRRIAVEGIFSFYFLNKFAPQARNVDPSIRYPIFPDDLKREWDRQNN